jgi:hypothetical protein
VCTGKDTVTGVIVVVESRGKPKQRVQLAVETETLKSLFYRIPTAEIVKPITPYLIFYIHINYFIIIFGSY